MRRGTYLQGRVAGFHELIGMKDPIVPTNMSQSDREKRARIDGEEHAEKMIALLGFKAAFNLMWDLFFKVNSSRTKKLGHEGPGDLVEIADACVDTLYVTAGTLCVAGISDKELIDLVCDNNDEKIRTGHMGSDGKFQKHPDHKPPDLRAELIRQGWVP